VEAALDEMKKTFNDEGITLYPRLHRPATFIENAMATSKFFVCSQCFGGAVLVLFSFGFAHGIHFITAIPLSLLTPVIILDILESRLTR